MLRGNLLCFSLCLLPLVLSLSTTEENLGSVFFALFPSGIYILWWDHPLWWDLFFRQKSSSTLSCFCFEACSGRFMTFMALCWTVSSMPLSLLWVHPVRAQRLVYAQCAELFIPSLLSWRVHNPCFSVSTCFLHPGICKGCTSCMYILQVTWWNFFWTCCFISVEIVCDKHEMHPCIFPTCDFPKDRINFLLQWNWLEYRSTQLLIIVSTAGLRSGLFLFFFFLFSHISFKLMDTICPDDKGESKLISCGEIKFWVFTGIQKRFYTHNNASLSTCP